MRRWPRSGTALIERIKERIAGIYQELRALPEKIPGGGSAGQAMGVQERVVLGPQRRRTRTEILSRQGSADQHQAALDAAHTRTRARRGAEPGIHQRSKKRGASMRKLSNCKKRFLPATGT